MADVEIFFPGVGQLRVPHEDVLETAGKARSREVDQPKLSLCLLFQRGSCRMDARCNQAHVPATAAQMARMPHRTCCYACGNAERLPRDLLRRARAGAALSLVCGGARSVKVPFARVVWTRHWSATPPPPKGTRATVERPMQCVCRLHRRGSCNRGGDCANVHVCRMLLFEDDENLTVDAVHEALLKNAALLSGRLEP